MMNNGILLNALLDKAFDRGLITFDHKTGLTKFSHELKDDEINTIIDIINGNKIDINEKRSYYLKYHLENVFLNKNE